MLFTSLPQSKFKHYVPYNKPPIILINLVNYTFNTTLMLIISFLRRPYGIDTINSIELRRNAGLLCGTNSKFKSTENPFKTEEFQLKMKKLEKIHAAYTRMKIGLRENPAVPDTRLSMISDNLPTELLEILEPSSQLRNANEDESTMTRGNLLQDNEGITIGHRRKQLREKAFKLEGTSYKEQNVSLFN